jgi:hypothetical protein
MKLENVERRPGAKKAKCGVCGKGFVLNPKLGWRGTKVIVEEIKTSHFRGDDEVNFYHPECKILE